MMEIDIHNPVYKLALSFINNTDKHIFLTGKAGTGKTTFLRQIRQNTYKKSVIAAPTGVSAINAEGMTIHTLFNLPIKPFIPTNKTSLDSITFNAAKRLLLSELELLILDEVSMLRADTLDAIDTILRKLRNQPQLPFGGVQVIYIGDLMQLSPIVTAVDLELLKQHYSSPFFIDSFAFRETQPVCLTLEKIYRQKDEGFITLLNAIRLGQNDKKTLDELNQFYYSQNETEQDAAIILTTHNLRADEINVSKLSALSGEVHYLNAHVVGSFSERSYPTDKILALKIGAQVMLIKNDKGLQKRYFNGKIGIIEKINEDRLDIRFSDGNLLQIEKETWKQIDYRYQQEQDDILGEELGSFHQFPVRLAWAITIHKSQGLTFENAVIDAADSFLPGQVYVALSRLSSKEGLRLFSAIPSKAIEAHPRIIVFSKGLLTFPEAQKALDKSKPIYLGRGIAQCFNFLKIDSAFVLLVNHFSDDTFVLSLKKAVQELSNHAKTFSCEVSELFQESSSNDSTLCMERIAKAVFYFSNQIEQTIVNPLIIELEKRKGFTLQRKLTQALRQLLTLFEQKKKDMALAQRLADTLSTNQEIQELLFPERKRYREGIAREAKKNMSASNAPIDYSISLQMFQEGKTVAQIAEIRKLNANTIEYQLATFLPSGEVKVEQLLDRPLLERVVTVLDTEQDIPLSLLKIKVANCSYGQLYAAQLYWKSRSKVP